MKERRLFIFLTFLPIALAIFFWDLDSQLVTPEAEETLQPNPGLPTTILEETRLTQYDLSGIKAQQITSAKLSSNDYEDAVNIDQPVITFETEDGSWIAQSQMGTFSQSENRLTMSGDVILLQRSGQRPVQMITEQLDYYPEARVAETSSSVTIETEGHHIESQGIRVDLAQSIYTLSERVRSRHEPL